MRAEHLVADLCGLAELPMRVAALVAALVQAKSEAVLGQPSQRGSSGDLRGMRKPWADGWVVAMRDMVVMAHAQSDASAQERDQARVGLVAVTMALAATTLPYAVASDLYEAAMRLGFSEIKNLLFSSSVDANAPREQRARAAERALRPNDRVLTLGERKSLARTIRREELLLVLRDPHPDVIAIALDNPRMTEADVVRLAASAQMPAASLELIATHRRWRLRTMINRAIVLNAITPLATALRVVTTMANLELRDLLASGRLHPIVAAHVQLLLYRAQPELPS